MKKLADRIAVITGGGGGIGWQAVDVFARAGATVIILDIDEKGGAEAADAAEACGPEDRTRSIPYVHSACCIRRRTAPFLLL